MTDNKVAYIQTLLLKKQQEIYADKKMFQRFLVFIPHVVDFSYEEQLQLFMLAESETVFQTTDEWRLLGRFVTPGERAYSVYNFETETFIDLYALTQTQGVPFIQTEQSTKVQDIVRTMVNDTPLEQPVVIAGDTSFSHKVKDYFANRFTGKKDGTIDLPPKPPTRSQLEWIEFSAAISGIAKAVFHKVKSVLKNIITIRKEETRGKYNEQENTDTIDNARTVSSMDRDGESTQTKEMGNDGGNDGIRERSGTMGRLHVESQSSHQLGRVSTTEITTDTDGLGRKTAGLSQGRETNIVSDVTRERQVSGSVIRPNEESERITEDNATRFDERTHERIDYDVSHYTNTVSDLNRIAETIDKVTPQGTVQKETVPFSFVSADEKAKATRLYHLLQDISKGYVPDGAIDGTYIIATSIHDTIQISKDGENTRIERALVYDDSFSDVVESGTFTVDDFEQVAVPIDYKDVVNGQIDSNELYDVSLNWLDALKNDVAPYPIEPIIPTVYPVYQIIKRTNENTTIVVFSEC